MDNHMDKMKQQKLLFFPKVNRRVFAVSAILIIGFIIFGAIFQRDGGPTLQRDAGLAGAPISAGR